jgi:hypothetical protein
MLSVAVLTGGLLLSSQISAEAYCGAVEQSAIGPNAQIASFMAKQKARSAIARSAGHQAANGAEYAVSCLLADQVGTRAKCTVVASYCVNPSVGTAPVVGSPPVIDTPPIMPRQPVVRQSCVTFRGKATGNSVAQAQELVIGAMGNTMAQRGGTLGSPGVASEEPACFFLDDGTNKVQCQMTVRDCR